MLSAIDESWRIHKIRVLCYRHLPEAQFVDISRILGVMSAVVVLCLVA